MYYNNQIFKSLFLFATFLTFSIPSVAVLTHELKAFLAIYIPLSKFLGNVALAEAIWAEVIIHDFHTAFLTVGQVGFICQVNLQFAEFSVIARLPVLEFSMDQFIQAVRPEAVVQQLHGDAFAFH